jgi:hypothetical protein
VIPSSTLFQESMRYSRTMFTEMDIVYNGVVLENDVPVVSGGINTDRGSNIRYSGSAEMALYPWDSLPLNALGTRVRLRRGVESIGVREAVDIGEYQIFTYARTNRGSLALTLKGLENYVIEGRFLRPRTPPYGASTIATIQLLINEVLPDSEFVVLASTDRAIAATGAWERERWDAVTALAASISAEVFCGHDGRWYIVDAPNLASLTGQYWMNGGPDGVLIEESRSSTRDGVYNAVSVSTNSSDQTVPQLWAWARDNDPLSPTYYYGPYGPRPRFYSSQFFTTEAQCQAYADRLLIESLAPNSTLNIGATPIPFLEAGDPITVVSEQGAPTGVYLVQKTALPLGNGAWTGEVLSTGTESEAA